MILTQIQSIIYSCEDKLWLLTVSDIDIAY